MGQKKGNFKAIATVYRGHRFRSRTEARWAVFFQELNVPWHYEVEGYELGLKKIWYLPDFYMPTWDKYIEVKPPGLPTKLEIEKAAALVQNTGRPLLILMGTPWPGEYSVLMICPCNNPAVAAPYTAAIIPPEMIGQFAYAPFSGRVFLHYLNPTSPIPMLSMEHDFVIDNNLLLTIVEGKNASFIQEDVTQGIHGMEGRMDSVADLYEMDSVLSTAYKLSRQADFRRG